MSPWHRFLVQNMGLQQRNQLTSVLQLAALLVAYLQVDQRIRQGRIAVDRQRKAFFRFVCTTIQGLDAAESVVNHRFQTLVVGKGQQRLEPSNALDVSPR